MLEKLNNDLIKAMKEKDKETLLVLRMVKAALKQQEIDKKIEINDNLCLEVISKEIKTRKDSIEEFKKGSRDDLISKTEKEIDVLLTYLPKQLTHEELNLEINKAFEEVKPTSQNDMGKLMNFLKERLKGKADLGEVSSIIKERLSKY